MTNKCFIVTYRSDTDPDCLSPERVRMWGLNAEHVQQKFEDNPENYDSGWIFVSADRPRDGWGKVRMDLDR